MIVFDRFKKEIAHLELRVIGTPFLFGDHEIEIRGYAIAAETGEFVRALREGDTYLVEDCGDYWRLHLVAFRGPRGMMVGGEPHIVNKEGAIAS